VNKNGLSVVGLEYRGLSLTEPLNIYNNQKQRRIGKQLKEKSSIAFLIGAVVFPIKLNQLQLRMLVKRFLMQKRSA